MTIMRRVGDILSERRRKYKLSLEYVAEQTRIKESYLQAIEEGNYSLLPPPPFAKGLIRNYASFLGLNPEELLAVFRREFDEKKEVSKPAQSIVQQNTFRLNPSTFIRISIVLIVLLLIGYFFHEYQILTGPPPLVVTSPKENQTVELQKTDSLLVEGKSAPEAVVTINDQPIALETNGTFKVQIALPDLEPNSSTRTFRVTIAGKGKSGKQSIVVRTVIVKQ